MKLAIQLIEQYIYRYSQLSTNWTALSHKSSLPTIGRDKYLCFSFSCTCLQVPILPECQDISSMAETGEVNRGLQRKDSAGSVETGRKPAWLREGGT